MNALAAERLEMENDLRKALERHEFIVYYQPQVDIRTNQ
jgi:EAL domain-containing protein (putative c-di-GMP-specific phosphodiesterase class I)